MNEQEARTAMHLAIGRLFRIMSRPYQEGDIEQFYMCEKVVMDAAQVLGIEARDNTPNWTAQRLGGAQGD